MALLNQVCALLVWAIALHSPVQPLSEFSAVCQPSSIRLAGWLNGCQPFSRAAFRQSDPLGRAQTGESDAQVQDDNVVTQGRCDRAGQGSCECEQQQADTAWEFRQVRGEPHDGHHACTVELE
jgi:hypothetical protein